MLLLARSFSFSEKNLREMEQPKRGRRLIEEDDSEEEQERIEMEETETKRGRFIIEEDVDSKLFLPPEIKTEILSRLPADSAIGSRGICKQWLSLIDHPSFIESHTRQVISSSTSNPKKFGNCLIPSSCTSSSGFFLCAQQEYRKLHLQFVEYNDDDNVVDGVVVPELKPSKPITDNPFPFYKNWNTFLITSCNGLVFMGSTKPDYVNDMFVCNPFTREYVNLRTSATATTNDEKEQQRRVESKGGMSYGFGYLPSTNEYKVVRLYYDDLEGDMNANVSVYTLGSGKWRNKGEIPYWVYSQLQPGLLANGSIHWFTHTKRKEIVSFDLADEEFRVVLPLPPRAPSSNHVDRLGVLGGCLCVTRSDKTRCESPKDIWVLNIHTKEKGEKKFSWNKRFSIPWKGITSGAKPHVILKSGKILLHGTGLICYDPKTGAFNEDREDIFWDPSLKVIPYIKSFVSLKALGEEDAKCFGGFV